MVTIDGLHCTCTITLPIICSLYSCCGAGTAADTEYTTEMISSSLELHRLSTGRKVCEEIHNAIIYIIMTTCVYYLFYL